MKANKKYRYTTVPGLDDELHNIYLILQNIDESNFASEVELSNTTIYSGEMVPTLDNIYDIGSTSLQWKDFYLTGIAYIDAFGESLLPSSDGTLNLGSASLEWQDIYIDGLAYIDGIGQNMDFGDFNITSMAFIYGIDSAVFIDMSVDGVLTLEADTSLELTANTNITGNLVTTGNLTVTGTSTQTGKISANGGIDISGDLNALCYVGDVLTYDDDILFY